MTFRFSLTNEQYQILRHASMRGKFDHEFEQIGSTLKVKTKRAKALVQDLENLFGSGETSWSEILGVE